MNLLRIGRRGAIGIALGLAIATGLGVVARPDEDRAPTDRAEIIASPLAAIGGPAH